MSYRERQYGHAGGSGGRPRPVSYADADYTNDRRPPPPGPRGGYYDRDGPSGGRDDYGYQRGGGYGRDREERYGGGRGGYERRRSRSPPARRRDEDGYESRRGGRYDDDDRDRRGGARDDRDRDYRRSPPPPRSSRRSPSPRRSRSPPRRRRDSRSPSPRRDGGKDTEMERDDRSGSKPPPTADDAAEVEEQDIAALMGFGGFGTTQGKKHDDTVTGAQVKEDRKYRQYMNRKGGFNRPLDKIR
ncbi:hypothetical protein JCM10213_000317 [Rhodosporidiobolus nylandii]